MATLGVKWRFVFDVLFFGVGCWVGTLESGHHLSPFLLAAVLAFMLLFGVAFVAKPLAFLHRKGVAVPLFAASALLLGFSAGEVRNPLNSPSHFARFIESGEPSVVKVTVSDRPHPTGPYNRVEARVDNVLVGDSSVATSGMMLLYVDTATALSQGESFLLCAKIYELQPPRNPHAFDTRRYWLSRNICHRAWVNGGELFSLKNDRKGLPQRVADYREHLISKVQATGLSPSQKGLMQALVLGDRSAPGEATEEAFRRSGITHLLCVSGLHVGIVALLLLLLLKPLRALKGGRQAAAILTVAGVWVFVAVTGMAPSTLRAGVMFSFMILTRLWHRRPPMLNAIVFSALVLLMVRPAMVHEMGFQLSYAAVSALVLFTSPIRRKIPVEVWVEKVWNPLRVDDPKARQFVIYPYLLFQWLCARLVDCTIAALMAQLATLPLSLYYFHQFPVYFLLANVVVVPFASLLLGAMALLLVLLCCGLRPLFLERAVGEMLSWLQGFADWVSTLPGAVVQGIFFDRPMLLVGVGVVVSCCVLLYRRRWQWGALAAALLVMLVAYDLLNLRQASRQHLWTVYFHRRPTVEIFSGNRSLVLYDAAHGAGYLDYLVKDNDIAHRISSRTLQRIDLPLVLTSSSGGKYLVVAGVHDHYRYDATILQDVDTLVLVSPSRRGEESWRDMAEEANVRVYNIKTEGSLTRDFIPIEK